MRSALATMLALAAFSAVAAQAAGDNAKPPFELVRELQISQNQSVLAGMNAQVEHRKKIVKAATWLKRYDPKVWADPKNARAAVIYVLSGGDPRVLHRLTATGVTIGIDRKLVEGALAYGERRDAEATEILGGIALDALDRSVAGHVALVRALLVAKSEPRNAFALLDMARVVSPGTVVEEAALRHQVVLAAQMDELDEFEALASQYFRRFARSIFVYSFQRQFAQQVSSGGYSSDEKRMTRLEALLRALPRSERNEVCLAIAEEGIVVANVAVVSLAARIAAIDSESERNDATRLQLFEAAALIVTDGYDKALAALRTIDRSKLSAREEGLLDAALAVAREIARPPLPVTGARVTLSAAKGPQAAPTNPESSTVIQDAQASMARVDKLLSEAVQ